MPTHKAEPVAVNPSLNYDDVDPMLKESRWVGNQFFNGGATKRPRLDEISNERDPHRALTDMSDLELAQRILNRADLMMHARYPELVVMFAEALNQVDDPVKWSNPNYGLSHHGFKPNANGTESEENDGSSSSSVKPSSTTSKSGTKSAK